MTCESCVWHIGSVPQTHMPDGMLFVTCVTFTVSYIFSSLKDMYGVLLNMATLFLTRARVDRVCLDLETPSTFATDTNRNQTLHSLDANNVSSWLTCVWDENQQVSFFLTKL